MRNKENGYPGNVFGGDCVTRENRRRLTRKNKFKPKKQLKIEAFVHE